MKRYVKLTRSLNMFYYKYDFHLNIYYIIFRIAVIEKKTSFFFANGKVTLALKGKKRANDDIILRIVIESGLRPALRPADARPTSRRTLRRSPTARAGAAYTPD